MYVKFGVYFKIEINKCKYIFKKMIERLIVFFIFFLGVIL